MVHSGQITIRAAAEYPFISRSTKYAVNNELPNCIYAIVDLVGVYRLHDISAITFTKNYYIDLYPQPLGWWKPLITHRVWSVQSADRERLVLFVLKNMIFWRCWFSAWKWQRAFSCVILQQYTGQRGKQKDTGTPLVKKKCLVWSTLLFRERNLLYIRNRRGAHSWREATHLRILNAANPRGNLSLKYHQIRFINNASTYLSLQWVTLAATSKGNFWQTVL